MRRITLWLLSTVSALVLLFSYHTSTSSAVSTSIVAQSGTETGTASGDGPTAGGSGETGSGTTGSGETGSGTTGSGTTGSGTTGSGTTGSGTTGSGSSGSSGSPGSSADSGSSSSVAKTYTGDAVSTRFGDVQVQITVKKGKVTKSSVTQVPWSNGRDQEINSYAVPILNSEAVDAQSASIDMVSGATYTSQGYIGSLQSAIDQANL
jgi:uncharacterized protein with FMN-binding domain